MHVEEVGGELQRDHLPEREEGGGRHRAEDHVRRLAAHHPGRGADGDGRPQRGREVQLRSFHRPQDTQ